MRLVVGFTAGSSTDITGRIFAQAFAQAWGQPVVVENIPGQGGAIGVDCVAKSPPDGHTLMWAGNGAITIVPTLQQVGFDPLKDLDSICATLGMASIFIVARDSPFRTLADVIAAAKAKPGGVAYGTPGVGTPQHIAVEMLARQAGIRLEHVPYRGANLADVMNGVLPFGIQNAGASIPFVKEGQLRGIAVTSLARSAALPDLPTVAEQGFPGFEALSWFGLMAPAGTPRPIIDKVNAEALRVLADGDQQSRFAQMGLAPMGTTPEAMHAMIARDLPKWAKVIAEAGIR
ncbi:Bug family tripartite tricarboxylate transporter substrate binding protein [Dankookia sp. GCM10030260]|uniref:Bug family tripartite tricarboxylate transporter substrate binding protein n=1 Tax=Dankookia sp. GCM10030260 TaxID=3273390 RepID=UPI00360CAE65